MATYAFTEQGPHEQGFERVFHDRIVPILERHEKERLTLRQKALLGMGGSGALGAGSGAAGWSYDNEFGFFGGAIGAFGVFGVKSYFEGQWKAGLGSEVLPILCDFLGEMRYGDQRIRVAPFEALGVVPNHDIVNTEDPVTGTHDGLDWALTEAILKTRTRDSKGRTKTSTVFRGLLMKIAIRGPAPRIFFGKDRGGMVNWFSETFSSSRKGLEKIEIDDADFEAIYETYTSDPAAARRYIDANLTAGLREIARVEGGKSYLSCAMEGDWLYLALPRSGDFLGLGSLFRPLTTVEGDLHEALADLDLPRRVLDKLRGM